MACLQFKQLLEGGRIWGVEAQILARDRVLEADAEGMKGQAVDGRNIILVTIHGVVNHGVFKLAQMHSDLVSSAGIQLEFQHAVATRCTYYVIMSDGQLAAIVCGGGEYTVFSIGEPGLDYSLLGFYIAPGHSHIGTVVYITLPVLFKLAAYLLVLAHNHKTGGVSVKSMHDMGITVLMGVTEIIVECFDGGFVVGVLAVGEYALMLVDYHKPLVFIHYVDTAVAETLAIVGSSYGDLHAGGKREIELGCATTVHGYAMPQNLLYLGTALVGHYLYQERQKLGGFSYYEFFIICGSKSGISHIAKNICRFLVISDIVCLDGFLYAPALCL